MIDSERITPEIAAQAERTVDTRGISYDEAYRELGVPQLPEQSSGHTAADKAREQAYDIYRQEFRLTGTRTAEQAEAASKAAAAGAAAVRAAQIENTPRRD